MPDSAFMPIALGPFVSGAMLLWGAVAAVPVVLHLLNRRRRQTVLWPAMQFLQQAIQKRSRNIQLWQWLLLLTRILAVLLIALALANPVVRRLAPTQSPPQTHLLVVDASYSMQASASRPNTRFDKAVDRAQQYLRSAAPGDRFIVVAMQADPIAIVSRPSANVDEIQQELLQLKCSFTPASLSTTLPLLERLLPSSIEPTGHVVFYTDAQAVTWQSAVDGANRAAWESLRQRIKSIQIVDVAQEDPPSAMNVTLSKLEATATGRLSVTTRADTMGETSSQLTVAVDSQPIDSTRLQFEDSNRVLTDMALLPENHESVVEATLQDDLLAVDNTRWLVRRPPSPLRVLCLGQPTTTRFIAAAMSASEEADWNVRSATVQQWSDQRDDEIDLLMLCDLPRIGKPLEDAIQAMQTRGSGIVWWLGPAAVPAGYTSPTVPFRLQAPAPSDLYAVDPRGYKHPIAAPFAPYPQSGLLSTPIFRFWQLASIDNGLAGHDNADLPNAAQVAMGVGADSAPFVLAMERRRQRSVVVTSVPMVADAGDSQPPWNALVAWPSLVPLVQEIAAWATAPLQASRELQVGDALSAIQTVEKSIPRQVLAPDGEKLDVRATAGDGEISWTAGIATQPGIYSLEFDDANRQRWAVNVDPMEGDLRTINLQSLPKTDRDSELSSPPDVMNVAQSEAGFGWFRWLLAGAMGWLVAESLISRFALRWQA